MTENEMIEQIHELYLDKDNTYKKLYEQQEKINELRTLLQKLDVYFHFILHLKDVDKEELLRYCKKLTEEELGYYD